MESQKRIDELKAKVARARDVLDQYQRELDDTLHELQHHEIERLEDHLASTQHKFDDLNTAVHEVWQELGQQLDGVREALIGWIREHRGKDQDGGAG